MEMLVALSIIVILAAITLPAMTIFFQRTQDEILQQQIMHAISFAKSEAQSRHVPVSLCKSNNQETCQGKWEEGQLVFIDENKNGTVQDHEQILSVMQASSLHGNLHWRSFPLNRNYLLFLPAGLDFNNGSFWYCHESKAKWAIVINKSGRARVVNPDENGVVKDAHGKVLPCEELTNQDLKLRPYKTSQE